MISSETLEVSEILSIATGCTVPEEAEFVQTKIKRKEVPANDFGIKAVIFVAETCGSAAKAIIVAPGQFTP